jgi:hypothetical protein
MASADAHISLRASDGDDAKVRVHDSHIPGQPIASIQFLGSSIVHASIMTAYDATPADLSAALRRLADRVDEAHAAWVAARQGSGTDA